MSELEVIFSIRKAARAAGTVPGSACYNLEKKSGGKVVTSENYLSLTQTAKKRQQIK